MVKGAVVLLNGGRAVGAAPLPLVMDVLTYDFLYVGAERWMIARSHRPTEGINGVS